MGIEIVVDAQSEDDVGQLAKGRKLNEQQANLVGRRGEGSGPDFRRRAISPARQKNEAMWPATPRGSARATTNHAATHVESHIKRTSAAGNLTFFSLFPSGSLLVAMGLEVDAAPHPPTPAPRDASTSNLLPSIPWRGTNGHLSPLLFFFEGRRPYGARQRSWLAACVPRGTVGRGAQLWAPASSCVRARVKGKQHVGCACM